MSKKKSNNTHSGLIGASEAAKILGLHVDTVRKRVKAGKLAALRDVNGRLWFDPAVLRSIMTVSPLPKKVHRTRAIFVIDRSGSMHGKESYMEAALADQIGAFKAGSSDEVKFEMGSILFSDRVGAFSGFLPVEVAPVPTCRSDGGLTSLNDATGAALEIVQSQLYLDPDMAFLVVVITDGGENSSKKYKTGLSELSERLKATGRVTVAVNCPPGYEWSVSNTLNVPMGNIMAFNATQQGIGMMSTTNSLATARYSASRSKGVTASSSYYADLQGDPGKIAQKLDSKLDDVTSKVDVQRVASGDPNVIRKFAEKKFGAYDKGSIFYELQKSEKVQDYKRIVVQDTTTGKFFHGWDSARSLLGLPAAKGEIKVRPGKLGEFKVFVQSTSYNRKLQPGSAVVKLA